MEQFWKKWYKDDCWINIIKEVVPNASVLDNYNTMSLNKALSWYASFIELGNHRENLIEIYKGFKRQWNNNKTKI